MGKEKEELELEMEVEVEVEEEGGLVLALVENNSGDTGAS